jgi:hypothetical protein
MMAEIDGDFVVFLIGARFNNKLGFARSVVDLGGRRGIRGAVWKHACSRIGQSGAARTGVAGVKRSRSAGRADGLSCPSTSPAVARS